MRPRRSRPALPHRLTWLLWLALLLPLAQAAAAWHAASHTTVGAVSGSADDNKPALHPVHCDLCLTAAALSGGALPTAPHGLVHLAARHAVPPARPGSPWLPPLTPAYHSRAPPFALT